MARRWERSPVSRKTFMLFLHSLQTRTRARTRTSLFPCACAGLSGNIKMAATCSLWRLIGCRSRLGSSWPLLPRLSHQTKTSAYISSTRTEVVVLYRWPGMRYVQLFSRVKFAQASLAALALVPLSMGYRSGAVEIGTLLGAAAGATAITVGFFWLSVVLQRFVGRLAYDAGRNTLTVSTLNFWGRRQDFTFDRARIVPIADSNRPGALLNHLQFVERSGRPFVYCLRYGQTQHPALLMEVLQGRTWGK